MFIELTDHLRCPAEHPESFLVLIPHRMDGRRVLEGLLGCPVCQAEYPITAGVVRFGDSLPPMPAPGAAADQPPASALHAFLGLEGPGGYVGLVGEAAAAADALAGLLPGVHLALVNPPGVPLPAAATSVLRSPRLPLKARSLRGIVLGRPWADAEGWMAAGVGAVLPGLRAVGHGEPPALPGFELLGAAGGWWVGRQG
ncbi:MAG: hypothetical protein IPF77_03030 [Gemmatimonadetes bacterium]|jgi:uncharacterized protein YbaR (Trm112 family)|nr:hypothetical protein [Gemmatimonadota bacterium]